jgi:phosphatidylserine/phosphatidylglycerophosphate/cardiolipin synthase-like enzyme
LVVEGSEKLGEGQMMRWVRVLFLTLAVSLAASQAEARIEICFSPHENCAETVINEVSQSTSTLDLALYSLTHVEISSAIAQAHMRGIRVRVIIDKTQAGIRAAKDEYLEEYGIEVKRMRSPKGGLMHHKFGIIDGKILFTGSFNWTMGGNDKNSENLNLLNDSEAIRLYQEEFERLWNR